MQRFLLWNKRLVRRVYELFIRPRQRDIPTRNREVVLNVLLSGTFIAFFLLFTQLLIGYFFYNFTTALKNAAFALGICVFVAGIFFIAKHRYKFAAASLTVLYTLLAFTLLFQFGNSLPFALMLLCLVIVLAGILLGARYAFHAMALSISILFLVEILDTFTPYSPDESWLSQSAGFGEVLGYSILLFVIGIVSWLFGRQNERSLMRAREAEVALLKEQAQLEAKIKERTLELQVAQFEEMQQLYRFAEVGQLSAALLHDLANHLAILTLDIEGLHQKQRSRSLDRARRSILYLDDMVERVRQQLHDETELRTFNIASKVNEVVRLLRSRATETGVMIEWKKPTGTRTFKYVGDSVKLNQIVAVVINNAIEAYQPHAAAQSTVFVEVSYLKNNFQIVVRDYGKGISKAERKQLFQPFLSSKKKGMGIGLFIARKMLEKYFHGTIDLEPTTQYTQFTIIIPSNGASKM